MFFPDIQKILLSNRSQVHFGSLFKVQELDSDFDHYILHFPVVIDLLQ